MKMKKRIYIARTKKRASFRRDLCERATRKRDTKFRVFNGTAATAIFDMGESGREYFTFPHFRKRATNSFAIRARGTELLQLNLHVVLKIRGISE